MFEEIKELTVIKVFKDEQGNYRIKFPVMNTTSALMSYPSQQGGFELPLSINQSQFFANLADGSEATLPVFKFQDTYFIGPDSKNNFVPLIRSGYYPNTPGLAPATIQVADKSIFPSTAGFTNPIDQIHSLAKTEFPNILRNLNDDKIILILKDLNTDNPNPAEQAILMTLHNMAADIPPGGRHMIFDILDKIMRASDEHTDLDIIRELSRTIISSMPDDQDKLHKLSPILDVLIRNADDNQILEFDYEAYLADLERRVQSQPKRY